MEILIPSLYDDAYVKAFWLYLKWLYGKNEGYYIFAHYIIIYILNSKLQVILDHIIVIMWIFKKFCIIISATSI